MFCGAELPAMMGLVKQFIWFPTGRPDQPVSSRAYESCLFGASCEETSPWRVCGKPSNSPHYVVRRHSPFKIPQISSTGWRLGWTAHRSLNVCLHTDSGCPTGGEIEFTMYWVYMGPTLLSKYIPAQHKITNCDWLLHTSVRLTAPI